MASFGKASLMQLATCEEDLQKVLLEAVKYFDFTIVEGHRGQAAQDLAFKNGLSQLPWPKGNHNASPSRAADIAPYPVDWSDSEKAHLRFAFMMGVVHTCAKQLGIPVRFGMDWNGNLDMRDETFIDMPHVELSNGG